jgi:hypothetical protein
MLWLLHSIMQGRRWDTCLEMASGKFDQVSKAPQKRYPINPMDFPSYLEVSLCVTRFSHDCWIGIDYLQNEASIPHARLREVTKIFVASLTTWLCAAGP